MSRSLRTLLNEANQNKISPAMSQARMGDFLGRAARTIRVAAASNKITLPLDARADVILACYVTAGTVSGRFTPVYDSTPATTQVSTDAVGNIVFLSTDAVTEAEVTYVPFEGNVIEEIVPVTTNLATPSASRRILCALEAEALAGTVIGVKTLDDRATAAPATLHAAQNKLGTGILFNAATDVVLSARIKYIATPGFGDQPDPLGTNLDALTRVY